LVQGRERAQLLIWLAGPFLVVASRRDVQYRFTKHTKPVSLPSQAELKKATAGEAYAPGTRVRLLDASPNNQYMLGIKA
jgi:hypothetical protein